MHDVSYQPQVRRASQLAGVVRLSQKTSFFSLHET
jgi:hypothetical protein